MPEELINLIISVVTSWQIIVITIAFLIFWSIVSSVVTPGKSKVKTVRNRKIKRPKEHTPAIAKNADTSDLGLEE